MGFAGALGKDLESVVCVWQWWEEGNLQWLHKYSWNVALQFHFLN